MGNNGSRKDHRRPRTGGQAVETLNKIEELRGPSVDSYDKLIAWLAEMAQHDNVELDTSVFVKQLSRVCDGSKPNKKGQPFRQYSASCESHTSSGSQRFSRSAKSMDDNLEPRYILRQTMTYRQGTFASSEDYEEAEDVKNASMESLYSGSDRDSEVDSVMTYDSGIRCHRSMNFYGRKKLKRQDGRCQFSSSTGELDRLDKAPPSFNLVLKTRRKSVSLLDLTPPEVGELDYDERQVPTPPTVHQSKDESFLDDKLLDGNIADILFSVEALWGK